MAIDLKNLTARELQQLIAEANREKKRKLKRAPINAVRQKLTKLAVAEGYSLMELFGVKSGAAPRLEKVAPSASKVGRGPAVGSKVAPKYRNPDDGQTWSGRGVHPRWLAAHLAAGRKIEDFLI
jgi:DNA-binding protein H-NS